MSKRPIIRVKDGKIVQTGKTRLEDGTIQVQPEGGIKFIPAKPTIKKRLGGALNKKTELNKAIQKVKNKTKPKTKGKLNPGLQAFLNKKKKMAKNKKKMG